MFDSFFHLHDYEFLKFVAEGKESFFLFAPGPHWYKYFAVYKCRTCNREKKFKVTEEHYRKYK